MSYNGYGMDNSFAAYSGQNEASYLVTDYGAYGDYGASRDVSGAGGYTYRQYDDGRIKITGGPTSVGKTVSSGSAWQAITAQIGAYPSASAAASQEKEKEKEKAAGTLKELLSGGLSDIGKSISFQPSGGMAPNFLADIFGGSSATPTPAVAAAPPPSNTWKWVLGGVAATAILGGLLFAGTRKK
jgi:hypothetical protein